ncbi:HAD-IA family hydrolase [Halorubrum ezzemoulense]|uniref:HAD family hydrolase n=1 Tax=Halorubrum ezzemoulense TaxID=337243 RepID=UPI00232D0329|nr:HAD-IA family hydrolase [Halorubrum ezzemoulense]MDB2226407.1 HAD-IA family hydrolase [Halorubrum ezzemoulense]MDB2276162.1 HAD-IA family hydrolase [Halorubrum ezzemoulense]MDB9302584.1 HAD-IA family hydrolase [Halorubrum ezzemoulense]
MSRVETQYNAIVFDNDGVLTYPTDESVLTEASQRAFAAFDVDPTPSDVRSLVDDLSVETVRRLAKRYEVDADAFWRRHETERTARQLAAIRDGEKPLYDDVETLADLAVPTAIVSNNQHATIEHIVAEFGLEAMFEAYYGREPSLRGLERRKPDPSYLEAALDELGVESALYVGDSRVDVAAARAAGVDAAFVNRPHRCGYRLDIRPTYRLDSLAELASLPTK